MGETNKGSVPGRGADPSPQEGLRPRCRCRRTSQKPGWKGTGSQCPLPGKSGDGKQRFFEMLTGAALSNLPHFFKVHPMSILLVTNKG